MKYLLLLLSLTIALTANVQAQSTDKIAFGTKVICALDEIGNVNCVTDSGYARLQPPSNTPALTTISAGRVHVCGIAQSGTAFCWGDNDFGQLNAPQDVQFIGMSSGANFSCGITPDNSVVCWGLDSHGETKPDTDKRYTQTAHDRSTSCGVQLDGKVSCWGQFPKLADQIAQYTFTKIDVDNWTNTVCGVTDQNDVRCNFPREDILGDRVDVALSDNLICGLSASGDISCESNYNFGPWQDHLAARIAEINSGPNVVALYGSSSGSDSVDSQVCYELETGEFGCIVRGSAPVLPGDQVSTLVAAQNLSADVYSESIVELFWEAPLVAPYVTPFDAGADIYRNNELLATTQNGGSYLDNTITPGVEYTYSVALFDINGFRSALSSPVSVTSGQTSTDMDTGYTPVDRPYAPTGLTVVSYSQTDIELFWDRPPSLPNGFNGYEIWRNHEFFAFTRGISFFDNSVQPNTLYHYDILAVNRDGTILGFNGIELNTGTN